MIRVLVLFFFIFMAGSGNLPAAENSGKLGKKITKKKKEVISIKKKIKGKKAKIKSAKKKETRLTKELGRIKKELNKKKKDLKKINEKIAKTKALVESTDRNIREVSLRLQHRRDALRNGIIAFYKFERREYPWTFFSRASRQDPEKPVRFFRALLSFHQEKVEDYENNLSLKQKEYDRFCREKKKLETLNARVKQKKREIVAQKKKKESLLKNARRDKKRHQREIKKLEKAALNLQSLLNKLQKEAALSKKNRLAFSGKGFGKLRGALNFPVKGKILSYFGAQKDEFNTTIIKNGIEIKAPQGSPVKAIYPGKVLFSDWFKGYGNLVILDHGDGYYSLSGHASDLLKNVGDKVKAGDTVALVGDTGSLHGSCLYFEIRYRGKPLDPLKWLARR